MAKLIEDFEQWLKDADKSKQTFRAYSCSFRLACIADLANHHLHRGDHDVMGGGRPQAAYSSARRCCVIMRLVLISDTHGDHDHLTVPDGDVLIHAGDMTENGEVSEVRDFNRWLGTLPHKHKLVIAGNHAFLYICNKSSKLHTTESHPTKAAPAWPQYSPDQALCAHGAE